MQRIIVENDYNFKTKVNGFLDNGWHVVPGTIGAASLRRVGSKMHDASVLPNGETFDHVCWCVVEKDRAATRNVHYGFRRAMG